MNLKKECTIKEQKLLNKAGIEIEDREYKNEELRKYVTNIEGFIMSHSSKNGDIPRLNSEYDSILSVLSKYL